ncbi:MAG TPA: MraY family glycosyltransferase [Tepidisphaeraceae bacterium]
MISGLLAQIPTRAFTADEVLSPYIYVFYVAFLVSFMFTPVMRRVATYYGIIDEPDSRKMHSQPVAYLGGVAVFLGWLCALACSQFLSLHRTEPGLLPHPQVKFSIVMGATAIVLLGLYDDLYRLRPRIKITGQIFAAVILIVEGVGIRSLEPMLVPVGVRIQALLGPQVLHFLHLPLLPAPFFPDWFVVTTSSVLVICAVVGCCNATNLMDGLDGLCGGVTAIIAGGFLFLAVHLAMFGGGMNSNWDALRVILGLALLGAVLGFIPYNFNPASIFMGDAGSMFLGFSCATLIILMAQEKGKWFLAAMVMFALPVLDTALAFARRWVNGRPLFSPDKFHFHHQLVARGSSVRRTVITIYSIAIGFAMLGSAIVFVRTRYAVALYLVIFGSIIVAAYKMGMVHERPRVVKRSSLDDMDEDDTLKAAQMVDGASVLEIEDDRRHQTSGGLPGAGASPAV